MSRAQSRGKGSPSPPPGLSPLLHPEQALRDAPRAAACSHSAGLVWEATQPRPERESDAAMAVTHCWEKEPGPRIEGSRALDSGKLQG
ncbi:MAG: hypothetical protein QF749_14035, partial [Verrucomicrobiota bacterium]|nr:hypothetical protein [Verrucomicrobiota bacterium]